MAKARLCLIGIFYTLSHMAHAAPFPATSSSALITENLGIYRSKEGFLVSSGSSQWQPTLLEGDGLFNLVKFESTDDLSEGSLTVRVDRLKKDQDLKGYTRSWIKDYSHYGFDVLQVKRIRVKNEEGILVDLSHSEHQTKLRQVVFLRDQKAVVLTCKDGSSKFETSLQACNHIINSFTWLNHEANPSAQAKPHAEESQLTK